MKLPVPVRAGGMSLTGALDRRRSVRAYAEAPIALADAAQLLWAAQGKTSAEGYRTAPSAGATFPLETLLVANAVDGLAPGIYRYDPAGHGLTAAVEGDRRRELTAACLNQDCVAACAAAVLFAAVFARTTAKYGEAGHGFVLMEAGHAAQNVSLQATALGLASVPVAAFEAKRVKAVAALDADEEAVYLVALGRPRP